MLTSMEKQRLVVNENSDKVDYITQKINTIEGHLPVMVQEILEFYFDKRVNDLMSSFVTRDEFSK